MVEPKFEVVGLNRREWGANFPNSWKKPLLPNGRVMTRPSAPKLRLASESRSTLAAARASNIDAKRLCAWQKAAQPPLPADPAEAAEVRALRAANKRGMQELVF